MKGAVKNIGTLTFSAVLCFALAFSVEGKTLYVAKDGSDLNDGLSAVYDGTHGPKLRIQSAIEEADVGDTVIVAPGIYGDEQESVPAATAGMTVRVFVNKSITLKSSGGKDETIIVGKRSDATAEGWGAGAVSGIRVGSTVATGAGDPVEIEGFTFRDCYSDVKEIKNGGVIGWNGGIIPLVKQDGSSTGPWVVSCVISNCSYQSYGAIGRVNAARVRVQNVFTDKTAAGAYQCNLVFCAFTGLNGQPGLLGSENQYAVNCTFSNGSHNPCSSSCEMNLYNSAFVANASVGVWCTKAVNCVLPATPITGEHADLGNFYNGNEEAQIASPLFGDFRPVLYADSICSQSLLCGNGDVRWLELMPSKYRSLDLEGNSFSAEDGRIHIGAVQTPMTPVAGFYIANTNGVDHANIAIGGLSAASSLGNGYCATRTFLDAEDYPRCFEIAVELPEDRHFLGYQLLNSTKDRFSFPTKDNRILFVPEFGALTKVCGRVGTKVFYVDANNGSDTEYNGLQSAVNGNAGPFETIQKAVDSVADNYGVIYVAPGLYNKGATEYSTDILPRCRIAMRSSAARIRILATGSAEETIIAGEADTTSDRSLVDSFGNGPNAVRCIHFNGSAEGCIQGFTITDGHTDSEAHTVFATRKGGGALMTDGNTKALIMDCIVTNNYAANSGAAMYGGRAARCVFADNRSAASGYRAFFSKVIVSGCAFLAKAGRTESVLAGKDNHSDVRIVHCTSYAEEKTPIFPTGLHSYWFNNVIMNNYNLGNNASSLCAFGNVLEETLYSDKGDNVKGSAYIQGSVYCVDALNGDLRLTSGSDAIGAGTAWTELSKGARLEVGVAWTNYYSLLHHDFNGDKLFFHKGNPTAGAYQKPSKHLVLAPVNRPRGVSVSLPVTNIVDFGESITLTAEDGTRKVLGLEVDGEFIEAKSFTVQAPDSASAGMSTVKVVANTNWYVDAHNGVDSNKGWTEDTPQFTLAKAMENVEPGDVVVALPGTYKDGSMIQTASVIADSPAPALRSRVVVPEGVSLVSRGGAESTIIRGEHADGTKYGAAAMRCVYLEKGARLSGFTVTGGATHSDVAKLNDNTSGAGVFCAEAPMATKTSPLPQTLVTDCIISNNVAMYGGGGAYRGCRVIRCRFFDNGSKNEGGALADCCVYDSIFDRNYGERGMSNPREVRGCTFGPGTMTWNRNDLRYALYSEPGSAVWPIYNCLFLGGAQCKVKFAYNCVVPQEGFISSSKDGYEHKDITAAQVETDLSYTPAYDSAAANAANTDYVMDFEFDGDVYGNPRRSNGGIDVGAVERDWRPRYAAMLGGKISIPEVSWEAVETSTPGVKLNDGNFMVVEWPFGESLRRVRAVVKFSVAEGAVLKVERNGSQIASYGSGVGEMRMADVSELERLVFLAEGGDVELLGFNQPSSLVLVVR